MFGCNEIEMKMLLIFPIATMLLLGSCKIKTGNNNQSTYEGLPQIKAESDQTYCRIGDERVKSSWIFSPQSELDSLFLNCYSDSMTVTFYTDLDSITFNLSPERICKFYVAFNDTQQTLIVVKGISPNFNTLQFDKTLKDTNLNFWYELNVNNEYLKLLRSKFPIDSLIEDAKTDTERVQNIIDWVHVQWQHNGNNQPEKRDAISILEEAKEGKSFRCVEYGIVATACLNAIGLRARTLALKTKDVETLQYGAGHVLLEVFLNDLEKWVLLDAQWDVMPVLNGVPLNAVEFQKAISENYAELEIRTASKTSKQNYIGWIYPYLFYFDISFDNRQGTGFEPNIVNGKRKLMLVPLGEKNPTIFQKIGTIDYCIYTNSLNDFYRQPQ